MDLKSLVLGIIFALMWSSAFTSVRMIVAEAAPLAALSVRLLISGFLGILIAWHLGQAMRLTQEQWRATIICGIFQNALYLGLNFVAMQIIEASIASIIASSMPLMVALAGWLVFRETLPFLGIVGLVFGILGVSLILSLRLETGVELQGLVLCVIAAMAFTVATLSVRGAVSGGNVMMIVGLQMIVGGVSLAIIALIWEPFKINPSWRLLGAFTYTTLIPGLLATFIWFKLVGRIGAVKAATFHFLNPFFGVLIAAVLLGEKIGFWDYLGVVIITLGILAVQLSKQHQTKLGSAR